MITPEQQKSARLYVQLNLAFQAVMLVMHLSGVGSLAMNLVNEAQRPHRGASPFDDGEMVGRLVAYALCGVWVLAGFAWVPVNASGLWAKKRWALTSTRVYWAASLITCCCTPFGAFGLWSLSRPGIREELSQ